MESNPAFYIEIERIRANLTDCIMPIHPFREIAKFRSLVLENPRYAKRFAESEIRKSEDYAKLTKMGLDVIVAPSILSRVLSFEIAPDLIVYVCRSKKRKVIERKLERIASLEVKAVRERSIKDRLKISRIEGEILGYPECCVSNFIELKKKSFLGKSSPPETVTILDCLESGIFKDTLSYFSNPPHELPQEYFAFFTSNFYPCTVGCSKAISIGIKLYEQLDARTQKIYRCKLILNVLNLLVSAYNAYKFVREKGTKTEFGKAVMEFFSKFSHDLGRLESISRLIAFDQLDFENRYILMHLD